MNATTFPLMGSIPNLLSLKIKYPGLKTMLFDMDGTLFDTEKYHTLALQKIGQEQKIIPPLGPKELHQLMLGKADHLLYEIIKDWPGFPSLWDVETFVREKNRHLLEIIKRLEDTAYFSWELKKLLDEAKVSNIQLALVTSSEKIVALELLRLTSLENYFDFVLTRDDSIKVKPDPWPYLRAMDYLRAKCESTLIFEDSTIGLTAAHQSGAHVIRAQWY